ncbi:hypothetical protein PG999_009986 [Apiospora kogelbergensis]|uniref:Post-SET domain-containing protein n=1 Tax=Apiospora kogelbergensis TaxID=1337665 RepID=A0AAW0QM12_9PEZI
MEEYRQWLESAPKGHWFTWMESMKSTNLPPGMERSCESGNDKLCGEDTNCLNRAAETYCIHHSCQNQMPADCPDMALSCYGSKGYGITARKEIPGGTFLCEYLRKAIDKKTVSRLEKTGKSNYIMILGSVPPETELTTNYGWDFSGDLGVKCLCGVSTCTGYIGKKRPQNRAALEDNEKLLLNSVTSPESTATDRGGPHVLDVGGSLKGCGNDSFQQVKERHTRATPEPDDRRTKRREITPFTPSSPIQASFDRSPQPTASFESSASAGPGVSTRKLKSISYIVINPEFAITVLIKYSKRIDIRGCAGRTVF